MPSGIFGVSYGVIALLSAAYLNEASETGCKFREVLNSTNVECDGTYYDYAAVSTEANYKKFVNYQTFTADGHEDETMFFFKSEDTHLVGDKCVDGTGKTLETVESICVGDNHVCVVDRPFPPDFVESDDEYNGN
eukprot:CAMPEP_0113863958 /NCGR_PEP_ID=MMETSP0372-20130328/16844_1 /TAXON_ID=340204 /ORGANISM="Lankesteria abbotti" /LENGTH=134 /DNA_ID=CAMNT_0000846655 /DNA_START=201 /DNA_END=602 /DNA_ORIENTATION=- /assembly_acc=CAM_ASM_000359